MKYKTSLKFIIILSILFAGQIYVSAETFAHRSEVKSRISYFELDGNSLIRTDSVVVQINERMGDNDAEIVIPYSKGDKVSVVDAWIEDASGIVVRKLKNKEIEDRSAISNISLYEDDFVKSFELKHDTYPYTVHYIVKVKYSRFLSLYRFFPERKPVRFQKVVVEIPLKESINYRQQHIDQPQIDTLKTKLRYTWQFSYNGYKPETNGLYSDVSDFPQLTIHPSNFRYGKAGNCNSWQNYGNWISELNSGRNTLTESETQKIDKLLLGITDNKQKARILYKYLQDNTRYINVSIEHGGLQTYPAEYVCVNKYGDCKALSNYMQAMLAYAGIKSYYTIIYSGEKPTSIYPDFPDVGVFNHAILTIPFGNDSVYLECTSKNQAFGYVHTNIQNRQALLTNGENSKLISIPKMTDEDVLCTRKINVEFDINEADVNISSSVRGDSYEEYTYIASGFNKSTAQKYIQKYLFVGSYDLLSYSIDKSEEDDSLVSLSFDCRMQNLSKKYGNNVILSPFPVYTPTYEKPEDRKFGVQINYPEYRKDTIIYEIPDVSIVKIPDAVILDTEFGTYSLTYKMDDNKLFVYKSVQINTGKYPLSQYKEFYSFIMAVKNFENKNIYIEIK